LAPGLVNVHADPASTPAEVAADLDGIDPALDEWLASYRARFRERATPDRETSTASSPKRGSVIGVGLLNAIGSQPDYDLSLALAEEIATALARVRGLIVISSASVANALAFGRNLRDELGLDFLLEGTLQHL